MKTWHAVFTASLTVFFFLTSLVLFSRLSSLEMLTGKEALRLSFRAWMTLMMGIGSLVVTGAISDSKER